MYLYIISLSNLGVLSNLNYLISYLSVYLQGIAVIHVILSHSVV